MKYRIFDIDWDTDNEEVDLPDEIEIEIENKNDIYYIHDKISDMYGFCMSGYLTEKL